MKKVIMIVLLLTLVSSNAFAGSVWGLIKNSGLEERKSKGFTVEVKGVDIRAYVFDVPEMKSVCISTWGDGTQQLECKTYKEMELKK